MFHVERILFDHSVSNVTQRCVSLPPLSLLKPALDQTKGTEMMLSRSRNSTDGQMA